MVFLKEYFEKSDFEKYQHMKSCRQRFLSLCIDWQVLVQQSVAINCGIQLEHVLVLWCFQPTNIF